MSFQYSSHESYAEALLAYAEREIVLTRLKQRNFVDAEFCFDKLENYEVVKRI